MTIDEQVAALAAAPNVLRAFQAGDPKTIFGGNLHMVRVEWFTVSGNVVNSEAQSLIVDKMTEPEEAAYWLGNIPAPLRPAPAEVKYLTSRTTGGWGTLTAAAQKTAIQNFCNEVYKVANAGAANIREFTVEPIDGTTVKVRGNFNTGNGFTEWTPMAWYVRLKDANGSVAAPYSNVEFHRVTGE